MDTIRYRHDGHFINRQARPEILEHLMGYGTVQHADGIAERGCLQRQHGHREAVAWILQIFSAQREKFLKRKIALLAVAAEIIVNHAGIEQVDAGWNTSMRCENVTKTCRLECLLKGEAVLLHQNTNSLDRKKRGVPFVHVINSGFDAELFQGAHTAYAEHDLLANSFVNVAAIELVGN